MKKTVFLFLLILACLCAGEVYAQKSKKTKKSSKTSKKDDPKLSKAETRALQSELKDLQYDLERYKAMKEENDDLENQTTSLQSQISQKKQQESSGAQDLQKKDEAIEYMQEQLRKLRGNEVNATKDGRGSKDCAYSVQIGAYKNKDLTQYMDRQPYFTVESDESGYKKYLMGYFTYYWEAKAFSKYLNQNGAQSYVVGFYKDKRIPDLKDMTQCTF